MTTPSLHVSALDGWAGNLWFLDAILSVARPGPGSTVLDVGAGTGLLACWMAVATGATVLATERDAHLCGIARSRGVDCRQAPANGDIPHPDASCDLVYCKDVLPSVEDKPALLREIRRVLRPGGVFVTYYPLVKDTQEKPLFRFLGEGVAGSYRAYGTEEHLLQACKDAGFAAVSTSRVFLGPVRLDSQYVKKHRSGYFSNTSSLDLDTRRVAALAALDEAISLASRAGVLPQYLFERTLLEAKA